MDKYEYKLKLEQIENLIERKDYETAAKIADSINWKKVKSVTTLCMIGDVYEKAEKYDASYNLFLMAYDRSPIGRNIIFRLTQIAVKMKNFEVAEDYYEEFLEYAPHDNMKYVLKYKIASAKGASVEERIAILEEFKEREYTEEWAYELAYLYYDSGNSSKCVEICDELILWFGEGSYVEKALELKQFYQPLNKMQEEKFRKFKQNKEEIVAVYPDEELKSGEIIEEPISIPKIKANPGRFNTQNLQEELAKNMQQILNATEKDIVADTMDSIKNMVKKIPYLYIPEENQEKQLEQENKRIEDVKRIDNSLLDDFKELLEEDIDGQLRLFVPDQKEPMTQIDGQLSIEDILADWEKTKQAAQAAMAVAEQKKLDSAKEMALQQAGEIMEQLSDWDEEEFIDDTKEVEEMVRKEIEIDAMQEVSEVNKQSTRPMPDFSNMPVIPEILEDDIEELDTVISLNEEQKRMFSYFTPVEGMEAQICQVLTGSIERTKNITSSIAGNILVSGGEGCGKTMLATLLIKTIQKQTGRGSGKVGKITADALNQKDIKNVLSAVFGGYLIIEEAGKLSKETMEKLSSIMEGNTNGLLIILEDTKNGIEKAISQDKEFARKFTEKIRIPIFTNDELVTFGKTYARENDCKIDYMGILALYNSINNIQKMDKPTSLSEVKEIVDDAIKHASTGGIKKLFGGKRSMENGCIILKEKDFE